MPRTPDRAALSPASQKRHNAGHEDNDHRVTGGTDVDTTLEITRRQDPDGRAVLAVRGEVDIHTAPRLRTALIQQITRGTQMVLDVTGAVLIDAAGLRALTAAQRHAAELGKPPITLRGVRPLFAKTLHLAGLDHLFPREPAPAPALAQHTTGRQHPTSRTDQPAAPVPAAA